ncbi:MAG TPA: hypothetical protein VJJ70_08730 [Anaerolineales bacterium]|nr:hypothetical protein [Anaerolineales bacterium]
MRTLTGFGVALVWTGGAAARSGGMAALAQWTLTRIGKGKDLDASLGASGPGLERALGGGDNVLQVLVAMAGSGVFWMIAGGLIARFLHWPLGG